MMTEALIHPADSNTVSRSSAPSIRTALNNTRTKIDWGRISVRAKPYGQPARSAKLVELPKPQRTAELPATHRWGIVLAGGDGVRLRELTQTVWGDYRPKQFCPLLGNCTLLEETRHRAERSVPPEQIMYSVARAHEDYYLRSLADVAAQRVVQPSNRGTAPAILSCMMHIARTDPNAIVAILPCDHYYSPENDFTAVLDSAFEIAEERSGSAVLLGAKAKGPEVDYGWIEVNGTVGGHSGLFQVRGFQEKPPLPLAEVLFRAGSLWNTFVMVGHARTFLEMARATVPTLVEALESWDITMPSGEIRIPDAVYNRIAPTDFARQVLSEATDRLLALQLANIEWGDLGDPYRLLVTLLEQNGELPSWAKLWPSGNSAGPRASSATA